MINLAEDSIVSILIALVPDKWELFLIADQQMRRSKQFIECAE